MVRKYQRHPQNIYQAQPKLGELTHQSQTRQQLDRSPTGSGDLGFFPTEFYEWLWAFGAGWGTGTFLVFLVLIFCLWIRA